MGWFESGPRASGEQDLRAPTSGGGNSLLLPFLLLSLGQLGQHPGKAPNQQNPLDTLLRLAQIKGLMSKGDSASREETLRQQLAQGLLAGNLQPGQEGPIAPYDENAGYALATQIGPEMLNAWRALRPALEAQGRVPHPDAMKQKVKAQGWAERAPGIASGLAPTASMSEDDIRSVAANVPPANLAALLSLPSKQALTDEQVKALQAKFPTIAPQAEATLKKTQSQNKKIIKETEFVGKPKAGKPSVYDKRVATWVENYLHGEDFADTPANKGLAPGLGVTYGSMPAVSRQEAAAADAKAELNPALRDIKLQAYQEAFGGGQGSTTAPAGKGRLSGQKTAKPDGTYKLPDGQTVTVRGGVIQ